MARNDDHREGRGKRPPAFRNAGYLSSFAVGSSPTFRARRRGVAKSPSAKFTIDRPASRAVFASAASSGVVEGELACFDDDVDGILGFGGT